MIKQFLILAIIGDVTLRCKNVTREELKDLKHHLTYNCDIFNMSKEMYYQLNTMYSVRVITIIKQNVDKATRSY